MLYAESVQPVEPIREVVQFYKINCEECGPTVRISVYSLMK